MMDEIETKFSFEYCMLTDVDICKDSYRNNYVMKGTLGDSRKNPTPSAPSRRHIQIFHKNC